MRIPESLKEQSCDGIVSDRQFFIKSGCSKTYTARGFDFGVLGSPASVLLTTCFVVGLWWQDTGNVIFKSLDDNLNNTIF